MDEYAFIPMGFDTEIKTIKVGIRHIINDQTNEEPYMDESDLFDDH